MGVPTLAALADWSYQPFSKDSSSESQRSIPEASGKNDGEARWSHQPDTVRHHYQRWLNPGQQPLLD